MDRPYRSLLNQLHFPVRNQLIFQIPSHRLRYILLLLLHRHCLVHSKFYLLFCSVQFSSKVHALFRRCQLLKFSYFCLPFVIEMGFLPLSQEPRMSPTWPDSYLGYFKVILSFAIMSMAFGRMIHSACSITRL